MIKRSSSPLSNLYLRLSSHLSGLNLSKVVFLTTSHLFRSPEIVYPAISFHRRNPSGEWDDRISGGLSIVAFAKDFRMARIRDEEEGKKYGACITVW